MDFEPYPFSTDDLYRVTLEGRTRTVIFERWHGQHALFYSVQDDWRFIVHHTNLRNVVKRVKPDVVSQTDYQNLS